MGIFPLSLLGFGFLAGVKHAFDIDHIAAVSTIASSHKSMRKSSLLGMFWGFGHAIALFFVGLLVLLLKVKIPEKLALSFEFIVGAMLIALGLNVMLTISKNKIHIHKHKHGNMGHIHFHSHKLTKNHFHRHLPLKQSLLIGVVHGFAGSAALTLLVLATVDSILLGLIYILLFGTGSIIGMSIISSIVSLPFKLIPNQFEKIQNVLRIATGLISAIIGVAILI